MQPSGKTIVASQYFLGRPDQLTGVICAAPCSGYGALAEYMVKAASRFDRLTAMKAYASLIEELLRNPEPAEQR
ncbi:hypothetical protein [Bradyrhizobium sp. 23AC]